jgi:hypothetical protein
MQLEIRFNTGTGTCSRLQFGVQVLESHRFSFIEAVKEFVLALVWFVLVLGCSAQASMAMI